MALGADDVQAAEGNHFLVIFVGLRFVLLKNLIPLGALRRSNGADLELIGILALLAEGFLGHELGVAAEQNIGTAAGHIGGDGDRALASGLGDDERFTAVIFGVQHFVRHALLL